MSNGTPTQPDRPELFMADSNPASKLNIRGHPIHPMLVPFPIAFFFGALLTDIAYWRTADTMWSDFSIWLLTAGLVMGGAAAVSGLIDFVGSARVRKLRLARLHASGNALALVLALLNAFVHSRDGYTAVVPAGLVLSGVVVLLLLVTGWMGGALVYRHRVGVAA